jgi:MarR family transcriptional repressor of emrRAB
MIEHRIEKLESALEEIATKLPKAPVAELFLGRIILLLAQEFSAMLDRRVRPHGLSEIDFRVLLALFGQRDGRTSPSDLCARTIQSPANMTRIGDGLVARGLVTRELSEQDRRRMVVRITDKGEQLVLELLPAMFGSMREVFKSVSADDKQQLTQLLRQIAIAVEQLSGDLQVAS